MQVQTATLEVLKTQFATGSGIVAFLNAIGKTDVCGRCGGCGRYSFNLMDADMCYGCNGRGKIGAKMAQRDLDRLVKIGPVAYIAKIESNRAKAAIKAEKDLAESIAREAQYKAESMARKEQEAIAREAAEKAKEDALQAAYDSTTFLGLVGDRVEFTGKIVKVISGQGNFGTWFLTIMQTEDGSSVAWWNAFRGTCNDAGYTAGPTEGDTVTVKATIKEHGRDKVKGAKQTTILRAKLVGVLAVCA